MQQNNKRGLFICQLPPPVHGAAMVNQVIRESKFINDHFQCEYINITTAKENKDVGRFSLFKLFTSATIAIKVYIRLVCNKYDFVYLTLSPHGIGFYKDSLIALVLKLFDINTIYHLHGKGIKQKIGNSKSLTAYYKFIFRNINVIHLSPLLKNDLESLLPVLKSFHTVPNGIPIGEELATNKDFLDGKKTILYLSNLKESKGAFDLLKATAKVHTKHPHFLVRFVGNWGEGEIWQTKFKRFISDNNMTAYAAYIGPKYGTDKYKELAQTDIFVLPTKNDCFPLSILEAMRYGKAVVSTYQGAIPEILSEGSGVLVDENNPDKLAEALVELIANDEKVQALGNSARNKFFNCYTQEKFERNFVNVLNKILKY